MSVALDPKRLGRELLIRGVTPGDLAAEAGISKPTVSAALAGRAVRISTVRRIAEALERLEVNEILESVLRSPD